MTEEALKKGLELMKKIEDARGKIQRLKNARDKSYALDEKAMIRTASQSETLYISVQSATLALQNEIGTCQEELDEYLDELKKL